MMHFFHSVQMKNDKMYNLLLCTHLVNSFEGQVMSTKEFVGVVMGALKRVLEVVGHFTADLHAILSEHACRKA